MVYLDCADGKFREVVRNEKILTYGGSSWDHHALKYRGDKAENNELAIYWIGSEDAFGINKHYKVSFKYSAGYDSFSVCKIKTYSRSYSAAGWPWEGCQSASETIEVSVGTGYHSPQYWVQYEKSNQHSYVANAETGECVRSAGKLSKEWNVLEAYDELVQAVLTETLSDFDILVQDFVGQAISLDYTAK